MAKYCFVFILEKKEWGRFEPAKADFARKGPPVVELKYDRGLCYVQKLYAHKDIEKKYLKNKSKETATGKL